MKYDETKWKTAYVAAAEKCGKIGHGPSDGIVCIMASLSYLKDGLMEEKTGDKPSYDKAKLEASFAELFASTQGAKVKLGGFLSNASAAMKFADLKVTTASGTLTL